MNNIKTIIQKNRLGSSSTLLVLFVLTIMMSFYHGTELYAAERTSYSIDRDKTQTKADLSSLLSQSIQQAPALVIVGEQQLITNINTNERIYIGDLNTNNQITTNSISHSFSIYDASVELLHDDDGDGYYHFFSVNFDADVDVGSAIVYARMYISRNGGPWNYYYTTKTFEIFSNNEFDTHTVDTVFSTGYPTGSYDIRIDLFEAGWTGRVAVFGPNEDYDLANLPLEDEEYDFYVEPHVDYIVSDGGCSLSPNAEFDPLFPILFMISLIYFLKRFYSRIKNIKYI